MTTVKPLEWNPLWQQAFGVNATYSVVRWGPKGFQALSSKAGLIGQPTETEGAARDLCQAHYADAVRALLVGPSEGDRLRVAEIAKRARAGEPWTESPTEGRKWTAGEAAIADRAFLLKLMGLA